jgi:hypothetical protein
MGSEKLERGYIEFRLVAMIQAFGIDKGFAFLVKPPPNN